MWVQFEKPSSVSWDIRRVSVWTWPIKRENNRRESLSSGSNIGPPLSVILEWTSYGVCVFHSAHNLVIKYISGARPSAESKRRICAMGRATSARGVFVVLFSQRERQTERERARQREERRAESFEQKRDHHTWQRCAPCHAFHLWDCMKNSARIFCDVSFPFTRPSLVIVGRPSLNRLLVRTQPCAHLYALYPYKPTIPNT